MPVNMLSEEEFTAKQDELKAILSAIQTAVEKIDDLQAALKSVDLDELITRITDSTGVEINPATEGTLAAVQTAVEKIDDLQAALASIATDQLRADVISSALPTGAATAARQDTQETSLNSIETNTKFNRASGASGQASVGTTNVALGANVVAPGCEVAIWADADNTGEVAVNIGAAAVVGTHAGLKAGQGVKLKVSNTNLINLIADAAGQLVNWIVEA